MNLEHIPPGLTQADLDKHGRRIAAREQAAINPLPGPLANVLAGDPITVAGLTLRPVAIGDAVLLQRIGSPLHRVLNSLGADTTDPQFTMHEVFELLYLWSRSYSESRDAITLDVQAWKASAEAFALDLALPLSSISEIGQAIRSNLERSMSTAVGYEAAGPTDGEQVFI